MGGRFGGKRALTGKKGNCVDIMNGYVSLNDVLRRDIYFKAEAIRTVPAAVLVTSEGGRRRTHPLRLGVEDSPTQLKHMHDAS